MATGKSPSFVDHQDRSELVDLVNRVNLAFDRWDVDTMVDTFTPDCTVFHPRGQVRGHEALRAFYDAYEPLTKGVRRHALNHVVDGHADGTASVTYYMLLLRVAEPDDAAKATQAPLTEDSEGLPGVFMHSVMTDRCRKDPGKAWRILERRVDATVVNTTLRF